MNKTYTLKELADIGAKAAQEELPATCFEMIVGLKVTYPEHSKAREAFTKAILDAIGYQLPKDEEREAFEKWYECVPTFGEAKEVIFASWKAGREELRKAINKWQDDVLMGETSTECDTVEELDMLFRTENSMQHQMTADAPWQRVGDCYEDGCESARHNVKAVPAAAGSSESNPMPGPPLGTSE